MHVNNSKCEQKATRKRKKAAAKKKKKKTYLFRHGTERSAYMYKHIHLCMCNIRAHFTLDACLPAYWLDLACLGLAWLWRRITETSRKTTHIQIKGVCLCVFFRSKLLFIFNIFLFSSSSSDDNDEVEKKWNTFLWFLAEWKHMHNWANTWNWTIVLFFSSYSLTHTLSPFCCFFGQIVKRRHCKWWHYWERERESLRKWSVLQMAIQTLYVATEKPDTRIKYSSKSNEKKYIYIYVATKYSHWYNLCQTYLRFDDNRKKLYFFVYLCAHGKTNAMKTHTARLT